MLRAERPHRCSSTALVAVAATQFFYFSAVAHMEVAPALLIEYTAPAAVVVLAVAAPRGAARAGSPWSAPCWRRWAWCWCSTCSRGPTSTSVGVLWSLAAMVGCATYFVMSADEDNGLPPIVLAAGGLVVGALTLALLGLVGLLDLATLDRSSVTLRGTSGRLVGADRAARRRDRRRRRTSPGIAASRRLGSRLASFVALVEVVFGVMWAWVLLDELPRPVQLLGGVLILAGVVASSWGSGRGRRRQGSGSSLGGTVTPDGTRTRPSPASCRRMNTSRVISRIAAAVGMASSAPTTPSSAAPTRAAITVTAPGTSTDCDITRG